MEIITKRLILKPSDPLCPDSACDYLTSADNARFMIHLPASSREEVLQLLTNAKHEWAKAEPSFYEFVILLGGIHVGGISIFFTDSDRYEAELGWIVSRRYWHMGIAYEAASGLIAYAQREWGIRQFIAQCDSENIPSRRLMEKLGMQFVSCLGGRKNRSSKEERLECTYALTLNPEFSCSKNRPSIP